MKTTSWYQILKKAFLMYEHKDEYAYFYGAKGQKLTTKVMNSLIEAYPDYWSRYGEDEIKRIRKRSYNRVGIDCSGFISMITGVDNYSTGFYESRNKDTTVDNGCAGQLLYTTWGSNKRHIGIDVGMGFQMDCAYPFDDKHTEDGSAGLRLLTFEEFKDYHNQQWEHSFRIPQINYYGSLAKDPNRS